MGEDRRRRFGTVRARVTAIATVVVLLVLSVAGVLVVRAQERSLRSNLEEQLEGASESLAALLATGRTPDVVAGFGDDDAAFQVLAPEDGRVLVSSSNLDGEPALVVALTDDDDGQVVDGLPHDDARFLVRSERVASPGGDVVVHVAASLDDVDESVDALTATLVGGIPVVTAVLALLLWFVVGRTLRPVEAIRAEVAAIGGAELHRRVPEPGGDDEVARLARTMNAMLGRIEESAVRQQRFVADASHELRSPLTRMRTELEVDLAHPDGASLEATHRSVLEEAIGMQRLVDDLLHLARADAGVAATGAPARVPLDALVRTAAEDLRVATGHDVDTRGVAPAAVIGLADQLQRLVRNLLDNAGRHARSSVLVVVSHVAGSVRLVVADDGPGIPAADVERVFQRFTRLDDARTAAAGGTGLGLAIARDIVEAHGGTISVSPSDHGARLVVELPAAPA